MAQHASDDELRRDIDLFTAFLGVVLREHKPKRVLVMVERLREGFELVLNREGMKVMVEVGGEAV